MALIWPVRPVVRQACHTMCATHAWQEHFLHLRRCSLSTLLAVRQTLLQRKRFIRKPNEFGIQILDVDHSTVRSKRLAQFTGCKFRTISSSWSLSEQIGLGSSLMITQWVIPVTRPFFTEHRWSAQPYWPRICDGWLKLLSKTGTTFLERGCLFQLKGTNRSER